MSILATPRNILTGRITNIVLRSTTGKWMPGNPGSPTFTIIGASGDSIAQQVILDQFTAVIALKSAQVNASVQITDGLNKEACSVSVISATQFTALGQTPHDDSSATADSRLAQSSINTNAPEKAKKS
jgi:hypothetical protein